MKRKLSFLIRIVIWSVLIFFIHYEISVLILTISFAWAFITSEIIMFGMYKYIGILKKQNETINLLRNTLIEHKKAFTELNENYYFNNNEYLLNGQEYKKVNIEPNQKKDSNIADKTK